DAENRLPRPHPGAYPRPYRFGHAPRFAEGRPNDNHQDAPQGPSSLKLSVLMLKTQFSETLASRVTRFTIGASVAEGFQAASAFGGALFPVHVQRQSLLQVLLGPDAVDALLCLAEAAVGPLHRVARRLQ